MLGAAALDEPWSSAPRRLRHPRRRTPGHERRRDERVQLVGVDQPGLEQGQVR